MRLINQADLGFMRGQAFSVRQLPRQERHHPFYLSPPGQDLGTLPSLSTVTKTGESSPPDVTSGGVPKSRTSSPPGYQTYHLLSRHRHVLCQFLIPVNQAKPNAGFNPSTSKYWCLILTTKNNTDTHTEEEERESVRMCLCRYRDGT